MARRSVSTTTEEPMQFDTIATQGGGMFASDETISAGTV